LPIALLEAADPGVLAHVHEALNESFAALDTAPAGKQHHDVRVEERLEIARSPLEPGLVDGRENPSDLGVLR
jgi:hypothetical protein